MKSLPNFSSLSICHNPATDDESKEVEDVGTGNGSDLKVIKKQSQRDRDYVPSKILKDAYEREDASRTRITPSRRDPSIAKDVENRTGNAGSLFEAIQQEILSTRVTLQQLYWCEPAWDGTEETRKRMEQIGANHAEVVDRILRKYVLDPKSWLPTGYYHLRGEVYKTKIKESSFRALFDTYVQARGGMDFFTDFSMTNKGHFTQVEWETRPQNEIMIAEKLATRAQLLAPMVDALRDFGFISDDTKQIQILWRFLPVRHNNSSMWHMDANSHMMYGDESMTRAKQWTLTGDRSIVTTCCINLDSNQESIDCGTRILSGVPALTEYAVDSITKDMWEERNTLISYRNCHNENRFQTHFNTTVRSATEKAIVRWSEVKNPHANYDKSSEERIKMQLENQTLNEEKLKSAGVDVLKLKNGELGTMNDHQYHAGSATPEGHARIFLVARAKAMDRHGRSIPFRKDAEITDGSGNKVELFFNPI